MCGVSCLVPPVKSCSSHVVCKVYLADSLVALWSVQNSSSFFSFSILMSATVSVGNSGPYTPKSCECSRNSRADPRFPVSHFVPIYDAYLDAQRFAAIQIKGNCVFLLEVQFWCNRDTMVGAWKKRWEHCSACGASVYRWVSPSVDSTSVRCLRRSTMKKCLDNSLLAPESWQCQRICQQLPWSNFDGQSSPFIVFPIGPTWMQLPF